MKIITWNVNGIRSIYSKGFLAWALISKADIICLQEIKAKEKDIPEELKSLKGYHLYFSPASKPGYSGVAVFCKEKPLEVKREIGFERFDQEGRVLSLTFKDFNLYNFYIPFGGLKKENLEYKLHSYNHILKSIEKKRTILVGDFNIAHQEIDLARPEDNANSIMFTQEERDKLDEFIKLGFRDSFREKNKGGGNYTWWAYYRNSRERNIGWRIDYVFLTKDLQLKQAFIQKDVLGSDHCPCGVDISL